MNEMNQEFGASRKMLGLKKARYSFAVLSVMALTGFVLTIVSLSLLMASKSYADQTVLTQTAVTVTSSCEMTSVVDTVHEATVTASTYEDEIGETTITVACNDTNGYAIYAVGFTNNEFGRNDMLGQTTGRTIATGTATSGTTSAWAMKLTPVDNSVKPTIATGYDDYHTVPDTYTKVVSYADSTMTNASGSQFKTTYATYVASLQTPDTYVGKVKYTLVHPADTTNTPCGDTYTIIYNRNGGSGSMESQTACVDRAIGLLPNGFTAPASITENQFAAWNTEVDGSGYTYYAGQSVMNLANAGETVTLYAQWVPKYIQDFTGSTCQVVASERPFTVYDRRDGNDYTVRFIEGACWMTQNLRITGTVNAQYSNFSTYNSVNVCEEDLTAGNSNDISRCHDSGNATNGVWYNYAAASAKTITGSSNTAVATEDICPAGWSLPSYDTSNAAGSINSLSSTSATSILIFSPATGGLYGDGSSLYGGDGYWWSATASLHTSRYQLAYVGGSLNTGSNNRIRGLSIRCTRVPVPNEDLTYMQNITSGYVASMAEGDTALLRDRRDGNEYTVAKIQGALWMTQNLRIAGVVGSQDSNFSTYSSVNVCEGDLTSGNSTTELRCHVPEEIEDGVWYNFASASAKTITGDSSAVATEDICPAGWHLPGYDANNSPGSINSLTSTSATSVTMFLPEVGGYYRNGLLNNANTQGVWWQSAPYGAGHSWSLNYFNNNNGLVIDYGFRSDGLRIRCVHL
ncbi:hypothetical protein IKT18_03415 [Candidatus Saccharibacteria bacterium]|nr:hypothetical protein [Candidatus Saccharibacteria bacterium]